MPKHKFDLKKEGKIRRARGGFRQTMYLGQMAIAVIELKKGGFREPHWHPNANEMTYCTEGKALITLFGPPNTKDTFTLSKGEVLFIPKGYLHHIENIHSGKSSFVLAYDHRSPEDLDLSQSVGSMSTHVLASAFGAKKEEIAIWKKGAKEGFIAWKKSGGALSPIPNPHKLDLERIRPQIDTKGGVARTATAANFPVLRNLALFSLRLYKKGVREPHWHPNATELNFVIRGKARLTILSPGGKVDTFELGAHQGSIIPSGYFHHIENIGPGELHMTVYFNNEAPSDIGLTGGLSAFSNELLASLFSLDSNFFTHIQKFKEDRMIVSGGG
jgi:oxalate decarboxylase